MAADPERDGASAVQTELQRQYDPVQGGRNDTSEDLELHAEIGHLIASVVGRAPLAISAISLLAGLQQRLVAAASADDDAASASEPSLLTPVLLATTSVLALWKLGQLDWGVLWRDIARDRLPQIEPAGAHWDGIEGAPQERRAVLWRALTRQPQVAARIGMLSGPLSTAEQDELLDFMLDQLSGYSVAALQDIGQQMAMLFGEQPDLQRILYVLFGWWIPPEQLAHEYPGLFAEVAPAQLAALREQMLAELLGQRVSAVQIARMVTHLEGQSLAALYAAAKQIDAAIGDRGEDEYAYVSAVIAQWLQGPSVTTTERPTSGWFQYAKFLLDRGWIGTGLQLAHGYMASVPVPAPEERDSGGFGRGRGHDDRPGHQEQLAQRIAAWADAGQRLAHDSDGENVVETRNQALVRDLNHFAVVNALPLSGGSTNSSMTDAKTTHDTQENAGLQAAQRQFLSLGNATTDSSDTDPAEHGENGTVSMTSPGSREGASQWRAWIVTLVPFFYQRVPQAENVEAGRGNENAETIALDAADERRDDSGDDEGLHGYWRSFCLGVSRRWKELPPAVKILLGILLCVGLVTFLLEIFGWRVSSPAQGAAEDVKDGDASTSATPTTSTTKAVMETATAREKSEIFPLQESTSDSAMVVSATATDSERENSQAHHSGELNDAPDNTIAVETPVFVQRLPWANTTLLFDGVFRIDNGINPGTQSAPTFIIEARSVDGKCKVADVRVDKELLDQGKSRVSMSLPGSNGKGQYQFTLSIQGKFENMTFVGEQTAAEELHRQLNSQVIAGMEDLLAPGEKDNVINDQKRIDNPKLAEVWPARLSQWTYYILSSKGIRKDSDSWYKRLILRGLKVLLLDESLVQQGREIVVTISAKADNDRRFPRFVWWPIWNYLKPRGGKWEQRDTGYEREYSFYTKNKTRVLRVTITLWTANNSYPTANEAARFWRESDAQRNGNITYPVALSRPQEVAPKTLRPALTVYQKPGEIYSVPVDFNPDLTVKVTSSVAGSRITSSGVDIAKQIYPGTHVSMFRFFAIEDIGDDKSKVCYRLHDGTAQLTIEGKKDDVRRVAQNIDQQISDLQATTADIEENNRQLQQMVAHKNRVISTTHILPGTVELLESSPSTEIVLNHYQNVVRLPSRLQGVFVVTLRALTQSTLTMMQRDERDINLSAMLQNTGTAPLRKDVKETQSVAGDYFLISYASDDGQFRLVIQGTNAADVNRIDGSVQGQMAAANQRNVRDALGATDPGAVWWNPAVAGNKLTLRNGMSDIRLLSEAGMQLTVDRDQPFEHDVQIHFISPPERRQYVNESTVDFGDSAAPQGSHAPLFLADGAWMEPASFRFCDTRGSGSITISGVAEPRQLLIGAMQIAIETQAGQYQDVLRALDGQQMTDVRLTILYRETSPHARKIARQFMNNNDLDLADYLAQKGEGNLAAHRLVRTALILHYGGIDYSELDNKDQGPIQARLRAANWHQIEVVSWRQAKQELPFTDRSKVSAWITKAQEIDLQWREVIRIYRPLVEQLLEGVMLADMTLIESQYDLADASALIALLYVLTVGAESISPNYLPQDETRFTQPYKGLYPDVLENIRRELYASREALASHDQRKRLLDKVLKKSPVSVVDDAARPTDSVEKNWLEAVLSDLIDTIYAPFLDRGNSDRVFAAPADIGRVLNVTTGQTQEPNIPLFDAKTTGYDDIAEKFTKAFPAPGRTVYPSSEAYLAQTRQTLNTRNQAAYRKITTDGWKQAVENEKREHVKGVLQPDVCAFLDQALVWSDYRDDDVVTKVRIDAPLTLKTWSEYTAAEVFDSLAAALNDPFGEAAALVLDLTDASPEQMDLAQNIGTALSQTAFFITGKSGTAIQTASAVAAGIRDQLRSGRIGVDSLEALADSLVNVWQDFRRSSSRDIADALLPRSQEDPADIKDLREKLARPVDLAPASKQEVPLLESLPDQEFKRVAARAYTWRSNYLSPVLEKRLQSYRIQEDALLRDAEIGDDGFLRIDGPEKIIKIDDYFYMTEPSGDDLRIFNPLVAGRKPVVLFGSQSRSWNVRSGLLGGAPGNFDTTGGPSTKADIGFYSKEIPQLLAWLKRSDKVDLRKKTITVFDQAAQAADFHVIPVRNDGQGSSAAAAYGITTKDVKATLKNFRRDYATLYDLLGTVPGPDLRGVQHNLAMGNEISRAMLSSMAGKDYFLIVKGNAPTSGKVLPENIYAILSASKTTSLIDGDNVETVSVHDLVAHPDTQVSGANRDLINSRLSGDARAEFVSRGGDAFHVEGMADYLGASALLHLISSSNTKISPFKWPLKINLGSRKPVIEDWSSPVSLAGAKLHPDRFYEMGNRRFAEIKGHTYEVRYNYGKKKWAVVTDKSQLRFFHPVLNEVDGKFAFDAVESSSEPAMRAKHAHEFSGHVRPIPKIVYRADLADPDTLRRSGGIFAKSVDGKLPADLNTEQKMKNERDRLDREQPRPGGLKWTEYEVLLLRHVTGTTTGMSAASSPFVSTSDTRWVAVAVSQQSLGGTGYIYEIRPTANFIDTSATLGAAHPHKSENEWSVLHQIHWNQIMGWRDFTGKYTANPDYDPTAGGELSEQNGRLGRERMSGLRYQMEGHVDLSLTNAQRNDLDALFNEHNQLPGIKNFPLSTVRLNEKNFAVTPTLYRGHPVVTQEDARRDGLQRAGGAALPGDDYLVAIIKHTATKRGSGGQVMSLSTKKSVALSFNVNVLTIHTGQDSAAFRSVVDILAKDGPRLVNEGKIQKSVFYKAVDALFGVDRFEYEVFYMGGDIPSRFFSDTN